MAKLGSDRCRAAVGCGHHPVMTRWIISLTAACATGGFGMSNAVAEADADEPAEVAPHRNVAVGYVRGQGLGNFGVAAAYTVRSVEVGAAIFPRFSKHDRGAGLAPTVRLNFAHIGRATATTHASSLYLEASPQLVLTSLSGVGAKAWGLSATLGYELRLPNRLGVHLGLGWHGRTALQASEGILGVRQASVSGPHIDAGFRYRF